MNNFAKYALIRMARTIAQTAIATIGTAVVLSDIDVKLVISASILAGILSLLTSIATGLPEVEFENSLYMYHDEPDDSEVKENDE